MLIDFKSRIKDAAAAARQPAGLAYFFLFLPGLAFYVHDLMEKSGDLPPQVAMRIAVAQMLMQGRELYTDFFEWTQPFVYEFGKIVYLVQEALGAVLAVRAETIAESLLALVLLFSATACFFLSAAARKILADAEASALRDHDVFSSVYIVSLIVFAFYMRFQAGELQWFMALAAAPWLLLRHYRYTLSSFAPPRILALVLGLACGFSALSDLAYFIVFVLVELLFIAQNGLSKRSLLSAEAAGKTLAALAVGLHFALLPEAVKAGYIDWAVPFKLLNYQSFDEAINGPGASPDQSIVYYLACAAILFAVALSKRFKLMAHLALLALCGSALNMLEKQGFTRDIVLTAYGATAAVLCGSVVSLDLLCDFISTRVKALTTFAPLLRRFAYIALALVTAIAVPFFVKRIDVAYGAAINPQPREVLPGTEDINQAVSKNSQWKDSVCILCDYPEPVYPLLFNLERQNSCYFICGRPTRLFAALEAVDGLRGKYRALYEHGREVMLDRFERKKAALVLIHGSYQVDYLHRAEIIRSLEENYTRIQDASYYSDNIEPREYLGFYYAFDQYKRSE